MPVEGKIEDKKILRLRVSLGNGTFTYPDGTEGKWSLTVNADSKLIFMEIDGKQKGKVAYNTQDMLIDSAKLLEERAKIPTLSEKQLKELVKKEGTISDDGRLVEAKPNAKTN